MAKISLKPGTMLNPVPVVMVSCGDQREKQYNYDCVDRGLSIPIRR